MRRIVIADDDADIVDVVQTRLSADDCVVLGARNGESALRLIREVRPDCAVLDVHMPAMDGLSVLQELKSDVLTMTIPVMMLSGDRDAETVREAVGSGAADYLLKPFLPDELHRRVTRILGESPSVDAAPD